MCKYNSTILNNISESSADRLGDGASTNYFWEKIQAQVGQELGLLTQCIVNLELTVTTAYRRVLQSTFNGKLV